MSVSVRQSPALGVDLTSPLAKVKVHLCLQAQRDTSWDGLSCAFCHPSTALPTLRGIGCVSLGESPNLFVRQRLLSKRGTAQATMWCLFLKGGSLGLLLSSGVSGGDCVLALNSVEWN